MLKELITLANHLDGNGYLNEASYLDKILNKMAEEGVDDDTDGPSIEELVEAGEHEGEGGATGISEEALQFNEPFEMASAEQERDMSPMEQQVRSGGDSDDNDVGDFSRDPETMSGDDFNFLARSILDYGERAGAWFAEQIEGLVTPDLDGQVKFPDLDRSKVIAFLDSAKSALAAELGASDELTEAFEQGAGQTVPDPDPDVLVERVDLI